MMAGLNMLLAFCNHSFISVSRLQENVAAFNHSARNRFIKVINIIRIHAGVYMFVCIKIHIVAGA